MARPRPPRMEVWALRQPDIRRASDVRRTLTAVQLHGGGALLTVNGATRVTPGTLECPVCLPIASAQCSEVVAWVVDSILRSNVE